MNQFSPNNPYNAPVAATFDTPSTDPTLSGFTKFLLILFIVFGVLGVAGGCFGLIQTIGTMVITNAAPGAVNAAAEEDAMPEQDAATDPAAPGNPAAPGDEAAANDDGAAEAAVELDDEERVRRMTAAAQNAFPGAMAVQIAIQMVSLIVSVLMLLGGIFGMQRKKLGAILVRSTSAFMIPFKLVECGVSGFITWKVLEIGKDEFGRALNDQGANPEIDPAVVFQIMAVGALIGIAAWGFLLILFYLVAFLHMGKASVKSKFQ